MNAEQQQRILVALKNCCDLKTTMHNSINLEYTAWKEQEAACCAAINQNLDEIIEILIECKSCWTAEYISFDCQEYDNEVKDWDIEFDNYLCQQITTTSTTSTTPSPTTTTTTTAAPTTTTTTSTVDPTKVEWELEFDDRLCQQEFDPSVSTTTSTVYIPVDYDAEYIDFGCQQEDNPAVTTTTSTPSGISTTTTTVDPGDIDFDAEYTDFGCQQINNPVIPVTTSTTTIDEDDTEFDLEFDCYLCQQLTTTSTTPSPTTTTTTSQLPSTTTTTTTAAPTTTTTTTLPVTTTTTTITGTISCGYPALGAYAFPAIYDFDLGTDIGYVELDFDSISIPDKYVVYFDGVEVLDTGYRGDSEYQDILYDALAAVGAPPELIVGSKSGKAQFYKGSATEKARVYIYAPIVETEWTCNMGCVAPVTTTTTTLVPNYNFEVEVTDWKCQLIDNGQTTTTTTTTVTPTTTTTTTVPVTTTTTTVLQICNTPVMGTGIVFPNVTDIFVGGMSGRVDLNWSNGNEPVKYVVVHKGVEVINTGYRGNSDLQTVLNNALIARGESPEIIQGVGVGTLSFNKSLSIVPDDNKIIVKVYAPLEETEWLYVVDCPVPTTTTTTTVAATTTTTTIPVTTTTTTLTEVCFGYLYNWYAAAGDTDNDYASEKDLAPPGWRVPTQTDWNTLIAAVGGISKANDLKLAGTTYWFNDNGLDIYGLGLKGGGQNLGGYSNIRNLGTFWTKTLVVAGFGRYNSVNNASGNITQNSSAAMYEGKSIILVKASTTLSDGETGVVEDYDGNVYRTICIGTQEWMAQPLKVTHFNDGTPISNVTGSWTVAITTPAYCIYNDETDDCIVVSTTTTTSP